jgi:hypothetical protein
MDSDDNLDFYKRLKQVLGSNVEWVEPSSELPSDGYDMNGTSTTNADNAMDSDGSADMVFSMRHVREEQKRQASSSRAYDLPVPSSRGARTTGNHPAIPSSGSVMDVTELEKVDWKEPDLKQGQQSLAGDTFVAWKFVKDYPDMYVGKKNREKVCPQGSLQNTYQRFY